VWRGCWRADIHEKFAHIRNPNVFPFQRFIETEKAGYLIRQYFLYNLYDRIGYAGRLSLSLSHTPGLHAHLRAM
jgi:hypothetical protein